jgi:hypothetical protein
VSKYSLILTDAYNSYMSKCNEDESDRTSYTTRHGSLNIGPIRDHLRIIFLLFYMKLLLKIHSLSSFSKSVSEAPVELRPKPKYIINYILNLRIFFTVSGILF